MRRHIPTILICIAILATLGTSAPTQDFRETNQSVQIPVDTVVRVTVRFSPALVEEAENPSIRFDGDAMVIPDDPTFEPFTGSNEVHVGGICNGRIQCDVGFSLDGGTFTNITVSARGGTASCGGNLHFSSDATIEVIVE